ncbi:MAG: hypothetical protein KA125_08920 [Chromatiaceae bacterium]|nr:hypothetical protein [Chromatiaceae bacterium]
MAKKLPETSQNRYKALIEKVFFDRYKNGSVEVEFEREDLVAAAGELGIQLPKNLGDVVYSIRYRTPMPDSILKIQPEGLEWIIEGAGRSKYVFKLVRINRILPNQELVAIKIPDATPEIVNAYALSDEQALLAIVRYNRLIDIFLGIAAYSLQNHLRTTVSSIGQVEIDEIYVAVDRNGRQYVLPVQAKGGSDQLSVVQTKQDIACCSEKYPSLICRAISAQFMANNLIALFELTVENDGVKVVDEKHYRLVPSDQIDDGDLRTYSQRSS